MRVVYYISILLLTSCASIELKDIKYIQSLSPEITFQKIKKDLGNPDRIINDKRVKDRFGTVYKRNGQTTYTFAFNKNSNRLDSVTYYVPIDSKLYRLSSAKSYFKMEFEKEQDFLGPHSGGLKTSYVNKKGTIALEMYGPSGDTVQFIHFNFLK